MASVTLKNIRKRFDKTTVLHEVSLEIADREFLVLVGPSGCGKSTLLRMLAGLEETTEGEIHIDGGIVNHLPPRAREIAMVFQDYALYPHMTVAENMSFGLRLRSMERAEIDKRVNEAADILQIQPLLGRTPRQLSGGQRQRVAIGRAIVRQPKVFLFDEPLSNLDAKLREEMRVEIAKLHLRLRATIVYVTHDQVEAMTLATRIAVVDQGRIQQLGVPAEVFNRPRNIFVAGFIGSPTMNFMDGVLKRDSKGFRFKHAAVELPVSAEAAGDGRDGQKVVLGVRPEGILLEPGASLARAAIEVVELLGQRKNVHLRLGEEKILTVVDAAFSGEPGGEVPIRFDPQALHLFDKKSGLRLGQ
ncbi:MAG: sn-glycerol-3-phosphate ABC transporter ATP-binding protein UgpC [Elusimicrobiota bacterium]